VGFFVPFVLRAGWSGLPVFSIFLAKFVGVFQKRSVNVFNPEVVMSRPYPCFLFLILLALGWGAQSFAATGHSAHAFDPGAFYMTVSTEPEVVQAGQQAVVTLRLTDGHGAPVTDFEIVHEQKLHLIIISEGLNTFTHIHPDPGPEGTLVSSMTFPEGGTYIFHADFTPKGGQGVTLMAEVRVEGTPPQLPPLEPYVPGLVQTGELLADVGVEGGPAGHKVSFVLKNLDESPVTDLQPYLGAMGHFVVVSADGRQYLHTHPTGGAAANEVVFDVHFPGPGIYKGWGEFQRGGAVLNVPVVMKID
jgi:hypothetical protein